MRKDRNFTETLGMADPAAEIAALRGALARLVNHYDALQSSNGATAMRWSEDFTPSHWIGRMSGEIEKARAL